MAWCHHSAQLHPGELLGAEWGKVRNAFPCTALVLLVLLSISTRGKLHSTVPCYHSGDRDAVQFTWGVLQQLLVCSAVVQTWIKC